MKKLIVIVSLALTLIMIPTETSALGTDTDREVILGGEPFGIKMYCDGAMVVKCNENSVSQNIKEKDVIIKADEYKVESTDDLTEAVNNSNGNRINLTIIRNQEKITEEVIPQLESDGQYRIGVWVKDSAAGLGTITFYRNDNMSFCGLGHGICESNTGSIMPISRGSIEGASITSVTPNQSSEVGCLNGFFTGSEIGIVKNNCENGIYGSLSNKKLDKPSIEVASSDEIEKGKAYIFTTISGEEPKEFEVEIKRINKLSKTQNLVIEITDEELLSVSNGIVQGMSGSPIIQNNKLVGAVTHVLVEDTNMGYGIFAETMYERTEKITEISKAA